jgi:DNA-nicking Smr family endonuclease
VVKHPPILDAPSSRRRRALSDDEQALWETVAKQIKPLRRKPRMAKMLPAPTAEQPVVTKPAVAKKLPAAKPAAVRIPSLPPSAPPLAPLGRRERSQLSRGRKNEARLDLHGMTQTRAHRSLFKFLERASSEGMTFVLVITGKGRTVGPHSERGVLRRQVPEWLSLPEFRALVVGFEEAHIGHGGEGALYVRVRRSRS